MSASIAADKQAEFYKGFLMARDEFRPSDFGIEMDKEDFRDQMVSDFNATYGGKLTLDELLLRPREAMRFCDEVRSKHLYYDLPDDIILRSAMARRKHPRRDGEDLPRPEGPRLNFE